MRTEEKKAEDAASRRKEILRNIIEGKKMEAYAEHRTREMHMCFFCGEIIYKRKPMKRIGDKWICIDCLRELKEAMDTLEEWEREVVLGEKMRRHMVKTLQGLSSQK